MTQKLTEEQQRTAHKIIVKNRGDCSKKDNYLNCWACPKSDDKSSECCANFPGNLTSPEFQAESLRTSQAWLASHPVTPQEPPKRRPTPDEMVVGAPVRVRLWDELVKDGVTKYKPNSSAFTLSMKKFCGNTYKIIKRAGYPYLEGCADWTFTPEMLDYVEPEKVVEPEPVEKAPTEEEKSEFIAKGKVDNLPSELRLFNFGNSVDGLRIADLENQVKDLTKKLTASERRCDRLARRLRAKWEAGRDGEMATWVEIEKWIDAGKGSARRNGNELIICPNSNATWIPATRGNLKL